MLTVLDYPYGGRAAREGLLINAMMAISGNRDYHKFIGDILKRQIKFPVKETRYTLKIDRKESHNYLVNGTSYNTCVSMGFTGEETRWWMGWGGTHVPMQCDAGRFQLRKTSEDTLVTQDYHLKKLHLVQRTLSKVFRTRNLQPCTTVA